MKKIVLTGSIFWRGEPGLILRTFFQGDLIEAVIGQELESAGVREKEEREVRITIEEVGS